MLSFEIQRKALDARQKKSLKWNYTVLLNCKCKISETMDIFEHHIEKPKEHETKSFKICDKVPFIIGAGPAGLFSALELCDKGFQPWIFERGDEVTSRSLKIKDFWEYKKLDGESNIQFGEGGAGTFSDGKLTARNKTYFSTRVFDYLIRFGADPKIKYEALPHIGTDALIPILIRIREYLIEKGARFFFRHRLEKIELIGTKVSKLWINNECYSPEEIILAIGNAARDTFLMLEDNGIVLESKPFAVGLRVVHSQDWINEQLYGKNAPIDIVGQASYALTAKFENRGIYSFCMCPGGYIINATSEPNSHVINGMSYHERNSGYANSAIVTTVDATDFGVTPREVLLWQRKLESDFFFNYAIPQQTVNDFIQGNHSSIKHRNAFRGDVTPQRLDQLLQPAIRKAITSGLATFDKKIPGFIKEGLLAGVETRTSSPIRVIRNEEFQSISATNLYPVGEGAGYAGGIISSAADGVRAVMNWECSN